MREQRDHVLIKIRAVVPPFRPRGGGTSQHALVGTRNQMAAIVISKERLLHLAVLVGCSSAFALLLMYVMGWSRMAAWGLAVTTVCQINKVVVDERDKRAKAEEKALQRSERKETEGSTKKKH